MWSGMVWQAKVWHGRFPGCALRAVVVRENSREQQKSGVRAAPS
ncbi:hypothetical protein [Alicyclobacillus fructus]|nr:hypothetical protein [Alicyclobacillus fructus]